MHANIWTVEYRTGKDLEQTMEKLRGRTPPPMPGFKGSNVIRLGENRCLHVALFDSPENAHAARDKAVPAFKGLVGQHLARDPQVESGEVLISM